MPLTCSRLFVPLAILCALWTILAGRSGMFIPHDERLAVQPGAFSREVMSPAKRLLSIDGRQIDQRKRSS